MKIKTTLAGKLARGESLYDATFDVMAHANRPLLPIEFEHEARRSYWFMTTSRARQLLRRMRDEGLVQTVGDGSYELNPHILTLKLRDMLS